MSGLKKEPTVTTQPKIASSVQKILHRLLEAYSKLTGKKSTATNNNQTKNSLGIVILAAGQGTRLGGEIPKPLRTVSGSPILQHLLNTVEKLQPNTVYIVHHPSNRELFNAYLTIPEQLSITWICQEQRHGTAHALQQALPHIQEERVLVLLGDVPFVSTQTLHKSLSSPTDMTIITSQPANPTGLGRIIRNNHGDVVEIIEEKNLNALQKNIPEVNTGIMVITTQKLHQHMPNIGSDERTGEFLLTDLIKLIASSTDSKIASHQVEEWEEVAGINTLFDLVRQEKYYSRRLAHHLLKSGVMIKDVERFDCRGSLHCAEGVIIDPNVTLEGCVHIEKGAHVGIGCIIRNSHIGAHASIHPYSIIEKTTVHPMANIGPFAFCRHNSVIGEEAVVGCFVETKATQMGAHSKAKHLSYLGDLTIKEHCNIGAGVIHCNYDGEKKSRSTIHEHAFVGAQTKIIAPVDVHKHALVAAGTTITANVPAYNLAIGRSRQLNKKRQTSKA